MEGQDEELVRSESRMSFEGIRQPPDRFERGKEDENSTRELYEVLLVETELFEEHDDQVVIDRMVVEAVESDSRLFRDRCRSDVGRIGRSVKLVVVVERNVVATSLTGSVASFAAGDVRRIRMRVKTVASQLDDVFEVERRDGMSTTGYSNDGATSHVVGNLFRTARKGQR
jgi:hypothetical protein